MCLLHSETILPGKLMYLIRRNIYLGYFLAIARSKSLVYKDEE